MQGRQLVRKTRGVQRCSKFFLLIAKMSPIHFGCRLVRIHSQGEEEPSDLDAVVNGGYGNQSRDGLMRDTWCRQMAMSSTGIRIGRGRITNA